MVVSHGGLINFYLSILLPQAKIRHPLGNLHYHRFTFDSQGNIVDAEFDQEWRKDQPE